MVEIYKYIYMIINRYASGLVKFMVKTVQDNKNQL